VTNRARALAATLPALALALTACGNEADAGSGTEDGTLSIVASTNVYGDVAAAIAGDAAEVTSIITSAAQDPHEYEATTRDRLAVSEADVVIENGGGYDGFVDDLLTDAEPAAVLTAVDLSGLLEEDHDEQDDEDHSDDDHSDDEHSDEEGHEGHDHVEGFNEHVWYDFHTMEALAEELAAELSELDPDNASTYEDNLATFLEGVEALEESAEELRGRTDGLDAAITEPVPVYLLEEVGLTNVTPDDFSEAVEEGADVPPRVLQETLDVVTGSDLALLAYNEQTADSTTEQVRAAAEEAGVPVVDFSETLPEGQDYLGWQQANLDAVAAALGGA